MKKAIWFLIVVLLLAALSPAALGAEFPDAGVSAEFPEELKELKGIYTIESYGALLYNPEVYVIGVEYIALTPEEYRALNERYADGELTDEEILDFQTNRAAMLGACLAVDGKLEEALAVFPPEYAVRGEPVQLGSADTFAFYYVDLTPEGFGEDLEEPYSAEIETLRRLVPEAFKNAKLSRPVNPMTALIGKKISFTAMDLDGAEHTSEELFAANRFTMLNIWGSWCGPCVGELGELAGLHRRMQEKGCGIVGLEYEYDKNADGKKVLSANGVTYPNVLANDDMDFMDDIMAFPTSIFVDADGVVVAPPITGAAVTQYEPMFDMLLTK